MIKPIEFAGQNCVFGGEGFLSLPVLKSEDGVHVSCWRLDAASLEEIAKTGVIWLCIKGGQPPVLLTTEKPDVE